MDDSRSNLTPISLPTAGVKGDALVGSDEKARQEKKLRKACTDFEAIFLYQMFKTMRNTIPQSGMTNKMTGKDTYEMIMDQKISEELAKKGGLGLQGVLFKQMSKGATKALP